jgi:two-component system sensor histidine kinase AgrC
MLISLIIFYFYIKSLKEKYEIQRNKDEQENLQRYTKEIEFQYTEMRKFKHDYQNILSSLESFVVEEDFEGLKQYYLEKIKVTSEMMNKHLFQLEGLSKIEVREIKSILAVKLMKAQEQGIDVVFEAVDRISAIPLDSVVLVRTLGILLDNAIEELMELTDGKMLVGVLKNERSITFIVQNNCRDDIPRIHQLKQLGFSTKGEGRGTGLTNLSEFVRAYSNMSIETTIDGNQFIQKITIGG